VGFVSDDLAGYVAEVAGLFPPQGAWTEADYLRLPHASRVVELAGGRLIVQPPPTPAHQRIAGDLAIALDQCLQPNPVGEVLFAALVVRLGFNQLRMPDVMFLRHEHADRKRRHWLEGPPDWIAEVLSPETRAIDEGEKLAEYARAAVPETWLVDPDARAIRVYRLSDMLPEYSLVARYVPGDLALAETIPGFAVAVEGLV
jgi:Uma2 family endonuclease